MDTTKELKPSPVPPPPRPKDEPIPDEPNGAASSGRLPAEALPAQVSTFAAVARAPAEKESFAETALKLGGKSEEEARRTGAIDRADDQVEALFAARSIRPTNSPIHRAVWDAHGRPSSCSQASRESTPPDVQQVMERLARRRPPAPRGRHAARRATARSPTPCSATWPGPATGACSVDREYGGARRAVRQLRPVPDADGDASIRPSPAWPRSTAASARSIRCARSAATSRSGASCRSWPAASGSRRFALTEPGAGSDLTALRTTGRAATATTTSSTARSCSSPTSCPAARSAWSA